MRENSWIFGLIRSLRLTHEQEAPEEIHNTIEKGIVFRGTNLWILIFAILVASVGLNMNSTAVIIGAMLISPLMGPINGVGYSVATYNLDLFKRSLKNLAFASAAGLIASTFYFLLTPIHGEHSELLARTSPTIYDVLIATFGGLAGIVAISSKNKGNVIPGVAIATALMPPLCTAGYGLATGNLGYFAGALYLFMINSVFIALSSMIVSQVLKLPKKSHLLTREIKNKNIAIGAVVAITVLPSFYLGITLVQKEHFKQDADRFVTQVNIWEGNYLLKHEVNPDTRTIVLTYAGNEIDGKSEKRLRQQAEAFGLEKCTIDVRQGLKLGDQGLLQESNAELGVQTAEINRLRSVVVSHEQKIDSLEMISEKGEYLLKELKSLYPEVQSCSFAMSKAYVDSLKYPIPTSIVFIELKDSLELKDRQKIERWLKHRLQTEKLILRF